MAVEQVAKHNETVYMDLGVGDLVEFKRGLYSHWAVFKGDGEVIHLSGEEDDGLGGSGGQHVFTICGKTFNKAVIRVDKFWEVVGNDKVYKNNNKDENWKAYDPAAIIERACSKLGPIGYNLIFNNCEHFASWCRYDVKKSDQVQSRLTVVAVAAAAAVTAGVAYWFGSGSTDKKKEKESEY